MRPDFVALVANHDRDVGDSALAEGGDLILENRMPANLEEALRSEFCVRKQAASQAGGKDDSFHGVLTRTPHDAPLTSKYHIVDSRSVGRAVHSVFRQSVSLAPSGTQRIRGLVHLDSMERANPGRCGTEEGRVQKSHKE